MCGVFGWVAKGDSKLNLKTLAKIAEVTEERGRHAWGMAWIDGEGRLRMYKQTGPISESLELLEMAADAKMLIGHTRWATQGSYTNNLNNHPHTADGGWIVHNGTIPSYKAIIAAHGLNPVTDCDSEVLGLLIESMKGSILARCVQAATIAAERPLVMLGLWKPGRLIAVRHGNPLCIGETDRGTYLASLPGGVPNAVEMPNNKGRLFTGK